MFLWFLAEGLRVSLFAAGVSPEVKTMGSSDLVIKVIWLGKITALFEY